MAIGFPVVVNGSEHPHVFEIRASLQEKIPPEIWFQGFDQRVLFDSAYKSVFDRQKQNVRLDLFANVALTFIPNENSTLFIGQSAKAALLLASYFRCNELSNILVSARCDLKVWPPDCEIVPLGTDSKAAIKVEAHRFGHTLFMHEADLAGIQSIEPEQWDRNGALPQIVRIRPGTTLRQLAEILQVRPFDAVWRAAGVVPVGEGLVDRAVARILNQRTQHFHGRDAAVSILDAWLQTATGGTRLVLAPAGVGKSALLANWIEHRRCQGDDVVQHFFAHRAPETTQGESVLDYLWRQLEARSGSASTPPPHQVADLLGAELARPQSRRLILVLDGLDEADDFKCFLPATMGTNVYVVLGVRSDGSGRIPKTAWRWLHEQAPVEPLHLAALDPAAMRAWLLAERPELVGASVDPWLRQLKTVSDGIPLFLRHVFDDLRATPRDAPLPQLPASFADYLQADLDWMLASHRTDWWQLLALLTCTRGPIARSELALLKDEEGDRPFRHLSSKPEEPRILRWLSRTGEDRNPRYSFIHPRFATAFAEVLPEDLIDRVRQWLVAHAERWSEPKLDYALQWGLQHQVEAGQREAALTLMRNLDFHCARIERFPEVDLLGASLRLAQRLPRTAEDRRWLSELAQCAPLLSTGAVTEQVGLLRGLAEDFLGVAGARDRPIRLMKPEVLQPSALVAVLQGHTGPVNGATLLPDRRILSWSDDGTLRLWTADGEPLKVLMGHKGSVKGARVVSEDRLLSWSRDHTLRLWDAEVESIKVLEGHTGPVLGVVLMPNGRIVSWSTDGTLRLWTANGDLLQVFHGHEREVNGALVISEDRLLSWSCDQTLRIWEISNKTPIAVLHGHKGEVRGALVVSEDRLLSWCRDSLCLWNLIDGRIIKSFEGHQGLLEGALVFSECLLLSWSIFGTMQIWHLSDGMLIASLEGHPNWINGALAASKDRLLSWSVDNTLRLWNATDITPIAVLKGHLSFINGAIVVPNNLILSWSRDGNLRLWNATDGTPIAVLKGHMGNVNGALTFPENRLLSWSSDGTLRLWMIEKFSANCQTDPMFSNPSEHCLRSRIQDINLRNVTDGTPVNDALIISEDRLLSWSQDRTLRLWNATDGTPIAVLEGHTDQVKGALVVSEHCLLSWSQDRTLRLWNATDGTPIAVLKGKLSVVGALIVSENRLLSWIDGTLQLWSATDGTPISVFKECGIIIHALYYKDRLLSLSLDRTLRLWNFSDETQIASIGKINYWPAIALPVSEDCMLSFSENNLILWKLTDGSIIAMLQGHVDRVNGALLISADRLLSWSRDKTLRLWSIFDGKVVTVFEGHASSILGALLVPESRLLSWGSDGTLRLWNLSGDMISVWVQPHGPISKVIHLSPSRVAVLAGSRLMFVDIGSTHA